MVNLSVRNTVTRRLSKLGDSTIYCRKIYPSSVDSYEYTRWTPVSRGTGTEGVSCPHRPFHLPLLLLCSPSSQIFLHLILYIYMRYVLNC